MQDEHPAKLRLWQKFLLICGLIWALLVIAPDVYRLAAPLGSLGLEADNSGKITSVDDQIYYDRNHNGRKLPAAAAGLVAWDKDTPGDVIDLDSAPCWQPASQACSDMLAVLGGMGGLDYVMLHTSIKLPILKHDAPKGAKPVWVEIKNAAKTEGSSLDVTGKILLALCEAIAIYVIIRTFMIAWTQPNPMTVGFFLYMMWFNPGQYFVLYAQLQRHPVIFLCQEFLQAAAQGAGYAGFLIFALRFPRGDGEKRLRHLEQAAIWLGVVLTLLQVMSFCSVFGLKSEGVTQAAELGGYAVSLFALCIVLLRRKQTSPLDFQRMRWVIWGCAIGIPAFVLADSNEATTVWDDTWLDLSRYGRLENLTEFFFLVSGITALFICEAIRKRRVISVSLALRRFLVSVVAVLVVVGLEHSVGQVFEFLTDHTAKVMLASSPVPLWLISMLPAVPIAMSHERISDVADRFLNKRYHEEAHNLDHRASSLKGLAKIEDVDAVAMKGPLEVLQLSSAAIYRDEGTAKLQCVCRSEHWHRSERFLSDVFSGACMQALQDGKMRRLRLVVHRPGNYEEELAAPALAIPIMITGSLYAVALYGPHNDGEDIDPMEIELLAKFADTATSAYEATQVAELKKEIGELKGKERRKPKRRPPTVPIRPAQA